MIIRSAVFVKSGLKSFHFPQTAFPEIAFAGRSNVGKSSLINALLGRRSLVRTSRKPGQTQTLNFFLVNDNLMLVDLPGYGFSRASKEVIRSFQEATHAYIKTRKVLTLVILLLDIRRLPSKEDMIFFQMIRSCGLRPLVVLTKADTVGRGSWKRASATILRELDESQINPILFSAKTGQGRDEIWAEIERRLEGFRDT